MSYSLISAFQINHLLEHQLVIFYSFFFLLDGHWRWVIYSNLHPYRLHVTEFCLFKCILFILFWGFIPLFFSFQVLLSNPIVVYSPRVLPVYVYDAHADCGKNVRFTHMLLSLIVIAFEYVYCFFLLILYFNRFISLFIIHCLYLLFTVLLFWCCMGLPWQPKAGGLLPV